ncbi:MAG: amino acid ABC transporter permease [Variibacter sp.]
MMHDIPDLLLALVRYNVGMTLTAIAISLPIACVFAVARLSPSPFIHYPATFYVNVLRSLPLVMIIFWVYTVGPLITGRPSSAYFSALAALAAFEVAYFTEIIRAGVQSVAIGQRNAGLASGLSKTQTMRLIILPQALRRMMPSLLTQSLIAFQDSTIASIISVPDILHETTVINAREQTPIFLYSALAIIYFVTCYALSLLVRKLEQRSQLRMAAA